jgi:hypothetical protein
MPHEREAIVHRRLDKWVFLMAEQHSGDLSVRGTPKGAR